VPANGRRLEEEDAKNLVPIAPRGSSFGSDDRSADPRVRASGASGVAAQDLQRATAPRAGA